MVLRRVRRQTNVLSKLRDGLIKLFFQTKKLPKIEVGVVVVGIDADHFPQRGR